MSAEPLCFAILCISSEVSGSWAAVESWAGIDSAGIGAEDDVAGARKPRVIRSLCVRCTVTTMTFR